MPPSSPENGQVAMFWSLRKNASEVACQAIKNGAHFQIQLYRGSELVRWEWVNNLAAMLERSRQLRQRLMAEGYDPQPIKPRVALQAA